MIEAAALIRNLQSRVSRLETLELVTGAGCLTLIEDIIPASDVTSIEFTSIPQTHKHLWLWLRAASDPSNIQMFLTINGVAAGYSWELMAGVAISSSAADSRIVLGGAGGPGWVSHELNFVDYTRAAGGPLVLWKGATRGGLPGDTIYQGGATLSSAVVINSLKIETSTGAYLAAQSRFTLYGLC